MLNQTITQFSRVYDENRSMFHVVVDTLNRHGVTERHVYPVSQPAMAHFIGKTKIDPVGFTVSDVQEHSHGGITHVLTKEDESVLLFYHCNATKSVLLY